MLWSYLQKKLGWLVRIKKYSDFFWRKLKTPGVLFFPMFGKWLMITPSTTQKLISNIAFFSLSRDLSWRQCTQYNCEFQNVFKHFAAFLTQKNWKIMLKIMLLVAQPKQTCFQVWSKQLVALGDYYLFDLTKFVFTWYCARSTVCDYFKLTCLGEVSGNYNLEIKKIFISLTDKIVKLISCMAYFIVVIVL